MEIIPCNGPIAIDQNRTDSWIETRPDDDA